MKRLVSLIALATALMLGGAALAQEKKDAPVAAPAATAPAATAPAADAKDAKPADPAAAAAAPAAAAAKPVPNKGDVAWMLTSTALVLLMSVPALALFYGGLVRSKNMLSVLMQVFVVFSLITVLWCVYGYSLAFTEGNAYFGGMDRLFLKGIADTNAGTFENAATFSKGVVIPELLFAAFQCTFAAITCCLILGALRRAREVLRRAALHGAVVHVLVRAHRPHGVVLDGAGRLHGGQPRGRAECEGGTSSGSGERWTSPAARWCTSTPAWRASWAPTWWASGSASARRP
jgi:uncharacterized membrane protein YgcG